MFNKTVFMQGRTEYVPYEKTVNHKYAATTEQAEYLEKLQKQAWEHVTDCITESLDDNLISYGEVIRHKDFLELKEQFHAVFTLNGKKFDITIAENEPIDRVEFMHRVYEAMAREITKKLLERNAHNLTRF